MIVATLPCCEMFQSKSSGILISKSTVTSVLGPVFTLTDPAALLVMIILGLPVTFRVLCVSIGLAWVSVAGFPHLGQNFAFCGSLVPHFVQ